jgi:hypothetical protein
MRGLLASPRRRRRLAWAAVLAIVAAAGVAAVLALERSVGGNELVVTPAPPQAEAPEEPPEKPIVVTPLVRRQVDATVDEFVRTAVVRRNLQSAWRLASPVMREGVTRGQWNRGDLPVVPYPAKALRAASWRLTFVDGQRIGIDVTVFPKVRSGALRIVYSAQLSPAGKGRQRRWLVDSWYPNVTLGAEPPPSAKKKGGEAEAEEEPTLSYGRARLSSAWLLVPLAIFSLILLIPAALFARGALARRRARG